MEATRIVYNDSISRKFVGASVVFALVGMLVGVIIALELAFWPANVSEYLTFGRLRPLHTNAVIFAFVGNMLFAGVYYSLQRLLKARIASDKLANIHFYGWQLIIVAAAITLPLGITTGKEYAELEWPIDIAIALVWVIFGINFFWTIARRNERHLYVAIWFYIATIVTITVLHVVNSLEIPAGALKSYSVFAGVQDALVQWWYGHNAVAFFLTTPILGIMYYYLPKAAGRPVFSYRLSVVHFWGLVFLYIWAGPHHLLYTALPDWAQTLGMIFSIMLWAPSWGGMINGLLTLRGAWDKLREDPVLKFFAAGVTMYGMSTFEGPLLSVKSVNGLAHYSDWIIGHVHSGGLGWNAFMAAGMFYWMVPRLFGTKLWSRSLANIHFWIGTLGIVLYVASMWVAGITQGLMWRETTESGGLAYTFLETFKYVHPMYWTRLVGGVLFLTGFILLAFNLVKTVQSGKAVDGEIEVVPLEASDEDKVGGASILLGKPVLFSLGVIALVIAVGFVGSSVSIALLAVAVVVGAAGVWMVFRKGHKPAWHQLLEGRGLIFTILTVIAVLIGGVVEIIPTVVASPEQVASASQQPYTPLQVEGRDVYIMEGCYVCHSQMIRPFTWETARYGAVSRMEDSAFDHPFQWGSRRIGPDLARIGGKYPDVWHYRHMLNPREISPGSNMPPYPHLARAGGVDFSGTAAKLRALRTAGVPYDAARIEGSEGEARAEAERIVASLHDNGADAPVDSRLVALIGYLQRVGRTTTPAEAPAATAQASLSREVR